MVQKQFLPVVRAAAAFERKDYKEFLELQQEQLRNRPDDPMALLGVSSAYACRYAVSGQADDRKEALRYLDRATGMGGRSRPEFREYEDRIRHRLASREILSGREYHRRFPGGWKDKQGAKS